MADDRRKARGIYGIAATPFKEDQSIDTESLKRVVAFTAESGCHGIVTPVMASEYSTLSDEERRLIFDVVYRLSNRHVPWVAGVSGASTLNSIELARAAVDCGADSVIAIPPHSSPPSFDDVRRFFDSLSRCIAVPIFVQNHTAGANLSPRQIVQLCSEFDSVRYVKEESGYSGQKATQILRDAGSSCDGVMGGGSGRYLLADYRRGMCGNMPASHYGDVMSDIWNLLESGMIDEAEIRFRRMLPLLVFEWTYGVRAAKRVLARRGIISSEMIRAPGRRSLDEFDTAELDKMMHEVSDLFRWTTD